MIALRFAMQALVPASRKGNDPGGSAGLQTRWVAPCVAGWVRLPFSSAEFLKHPRRAARVLLKVAAPAAGQSPFRGVPRLVPGGRGASCLYGPLFS